MVYKFDDFILDAENNRLFRANKVVSTDDKIVKALLLLCQSYPNAVDKDTLLAQLWPSQVVTEWSISKLISEIRHVIGDNGKDQGFIKTVRGQGFRMNTPVTEATIPHVPSTQTSSSSKNKSIFTRPIAVALLAVVIIAIVSAYMFTSQNKEQTTDHPLRIAVLPVASDEDPGIHEWVEYGVMAIVSEQLSQYPSLQTIPLEQVVATVNSQGNNSFEDVCGQLGCTKLIALNFAMVGSKPQLSYSIVEQESSSLPVSFIGNDPIDAANQMIEALTVNLIPADQEVLSLSSTFTSNNKTNRDYAIGVHELHSGELVEARKYLELALERAPEFFWAKANLAEVMYRQGEFNESESLIQQLEQSELNDEQTYFLMHLRSNILYSQGKVKESLAVTMALRANPYVVADPLLYGNESLNIGSSMQALGNNEDAISYLNEARDSYVKAGYGSGEGKVLFNLGNVYLTSSQQQKAIEHYLQAKDVFIRYRLTGYVLFVRHQVATTNIQLGNTQDAEQELYLLIEDYRKIGDAEGEYTALNDLAYVSLYQENYEEAATRASEAFKRLQPTQFSYLKQQIVNIGAKANLMLGRTDAAADYLAQATGDWKDPRASFVFLPIHLEYLQGNLKQALDSALALKQQMGEQWSQEHEKVLMQIQRSVDQNQQFDLTY